MSPTADFDVTAYRANFIRSSPLVLAVPVAVALVVIGAGTPFNATAAVVGAIGCIAALAVRALLAGIVMAAVQPDRFTGEPIVAGASGAAAEAVRVLLLLVVGVAAFNAVWVGIGWGASEAVWALVSRGAVLALMGRDPESQARSLLPDEELSGPYWGVVEQLSSTLAHIAFSLVIALSPSYVVVTAIAHAAKDALAVRLGWTLTPGPRQAVGLAWAVLLLGAAWLVWRMAS